MKSRTSATPHRMTVREAWRRAREIEVVTGVWFGWTPMAEIACIIRGDELTETNIEHMYQHGIWMGRKPP